MLRLNLMKFMIFLNIISLMEELFILGQEPLLSVEEQKSSIIIFTIFQLLEYTRIIFHGELRYLEIFFGMWGVEAGRPAVNVNGGGECRTFNNLMIDCIQMYWQGARKRRTMV